MSAPPDGTLPFTQTSLAPQSLGPLTADETERLVSSLAEGMPLDATARKAIADASGGSPLLIEQLVFSTGCGGGPIDADGGLRSLVATRMAALGAAEDTLQAAAVLGVEFRLDVVSAMVSRPEIDAKRDLDHLIKAGLVRRGRSLGELTYSFRHSLVREAVYDLVPESARRRVHARAARLLEVQFADVAEARPELLALHHARAGHLGAAIAYAQRAAIGALVRAANDDVVHFAQTALAWAESITDSAQRAPIERGLNDLLIRVWRAGHTPFSKQTVDAVKAPPGQPQVSGQTKRSRLIAPSDGRRRRRGPR
jgi:hypothetical protein